MNDGILLVDKHRGVTSAGVVRDVKRAHRVKSIGHLGTLDPMATGLLPLCVGSGTKIAQFLGAESKAYTGTIRLGLATDTLDAEGQVLERAEVPSNVAQRLADVASSHVGPCEQRPPMYSAVKQGGRPLYELARAGVTVERALRPIEILSLSLEPTDESDVIAFRVRCSKGTYVRVLAEDIARSLGTLGTLESLRRTEFGEFRIEEAETVERVLERPAGVLPVIPPLDALRSARRIAVGPEVAYVVATGQRGALSTVAPPQGAERLAALLAPNGGLLAVLEAEGGEWMLRRVLMPEASQLYRS